MSGDFCYYVFMLKKRIEKQSELEFVSIEELVPSDHLLRQISQTLDFEFIRDKVRDLYCPDNGRPALDPVVLFKMLFLGYLFGIRSERQLVKEIEVNVAYRWFLDMGLREKVPDHSTISQNRRRRFLGSGIYQEIFDEIVLEAMRRGLADGKVLYTDSTHLKANANKQKFEKQLVSRSTRDYLSDLESDVNEDREAHGKKALAPKPLEPEVKQTRVSTTDPESGYLVRDGKPKGFYYLDHRTVDGRYNIITDTHVTPGNVHDSIPYLERLDRQRSRFGFEVESVGLDAGYSTASICKGLEDRGIYGVIGYSRPVHRKGYLRKSDFVYDEYYDCYLCPMDQVLKYRTTNRDGYREYVSNPRECRTCPLLSRCTQSANQVKVVTRHVWQDYKERVDDHRFEHSGKQIYQRRKETVERSFADSKQLHGHRYARMRGLDKVREQCLLSAACQNMKKIARILSRKGISLFFALWRGWQGLKMRLYQNCPPPIYKNA
jgi:transposase/ribulose bisphosphate carboxylase small subunit